MKLRVPRIEGLFEVLGKVVALSALARAVAELVGLLAVGTRADLDAFLRRVVRKYAIDRSLLLSGIISRVSHQSTNQGQNSYF